MAITGGIIAGAAGSGIQAYAQAEAGKTNQRIADYNADQLDAQARDAIVRGDSAANVRRIEGRGVIGTQKVAFASQGVLIGDGSAADVEYDTLDRIDQDVVGIKTNAALTAWGYGNQASIMRYQGQMAHRAGNMAALSTIIGGAGKAGAGAGAL